MEVLMPSEVFMTNWFTYQAHGTSIDSDDEKMMV